MGGAARTCDYPKYLMQEFKQTKVVAGFHLESTILAPGQQRCCQVRTLGSVDEIYIAGLRRLRWVQDDGMRWLIDERRGRGNPIQYIK